MIGVLAKGATEALPQELLARMGAAVNPNAGLEQAAVEAVQPPEHSLGDVMQPAGSGPRRAMRGRHKATRPAQGGSADLCVIVCVVS